MLIFVAFGQSNYANLGIAAKFQYAVNTKSSYIYALNNNSDSILN